MKILSVILAALLLFTTVATAAPLGTPCIEVQGQIPCPPPDTRERFNFWMPTSAGNWKNVQFASDWGLAQTVYSGSDVVSTFYSRGNRALYVDQYILWPVPETGTVYVFDQAAWQYVGELRDGDDANLQVVVDYINTHTSKKTLNFWQDFQDGWSTAADNRCTEATLETALAGGGLIVAIGVTVYATPVTGPVGWSLGGMGLAYGNFINKVRLEIRDCQMIPPK